MTIPNRVRERLIQGLKRYQPVLASAKARDINEADTVTIVKDLLADIFGFDKYADITSEYAIRGTYVDLAIKLDNTLHLLLEVKAIGLELKDAFVKQAVDYAANQGVEWVVLTNGIVWRIYRISFKQPIEQELVAKIDLLTATPKNESDLETLNLLSKEGITKSLLNDYHAQRQALSRYSVGALLMSDAIVDVVRRELRKMSPDVRIDSDQIREVLGNEVIKREVLEGERADDARRKVNRSVAKAQKRAARPTGAAETESIEDDAAVDAVAEVAQESIADA